MNLHRWASWAFQVAVLYLIGVSACSADWQYTMWGMTEAEIVTASGNAASAVAGEDRKLKSYEGLEARLSAPYSTGEFNFTAYFHFDPASNELVKVSLKLLNGADAIKLERSLRLKYGNPTETQVVANILTVESWLRETDEVGLAYDRGSATVSYTPRIAEGNEGL